MTDYVIRNKWHISTTPTIHFQNSMLCGLMIQISITRLNQTYLRSPGKII